MKRILNFLTETLIDDSNLIKLNLYFMYHTIHQLKNKLKLLMDLHLTKYNMILGFHQGIVQM